MPTRPYRPTRPYSHRLYYLDDHPDMIKAVIRGIPFREEEKTSGKNLADLRKYLEVRLARSFIIDGEFPRETGSEVEFLAHEAIKLIREKSDEPRIAILTFSPKNAVKLEAKRIKVFDKATVDLRDLASWLQEI